MIGNQKQPPSYVVGPVGEPLTMKSLPPANTRRWRKRRKAELVAAVDGGLLSVDGACDRYGLTLEKLATWQRATERSGIPKVKKRDNRFLNRTKGGPVTAPSFADRLQRLR